MKRLLGLAAAGMLALLVAASDRSRAVAQDLSRPLRIIAPLAAGSTFDLLARAVGSRWEERSGQTVVVENRPGANMSVAANACKAAAADGNTICLFTHNLFLNPLIHAKLSYDPLADFEPIASLCLLEQVFVVSRRVPAGTFAELVRYSKQDPDKLNYASVGVGSAAHLVIEWLRAVSGGEWKHVPFNGAPQVQAAIAAGDVHMTFTPTGNVMGRIAAGELKALLTAGEKRNALLPEVPTFAEAGLPELKAKSWAGLFAPAGTPASAIARRHAGFSEIVAEANFQQRHLARLGLTPAAMDLSAFKRFVPADQQAWRPLVKQSGILPN